MRYVAPNEPTEAARVVYFDLRGTDGLAIATGEAGGQPRIFYQGLSASTPTGIGVLHNEDGSITGANARGRYYAYLTQTVCIDGRVIETTYESVTTAPCIPGDTIVIGSIGSGALAQSGQTAGATLYRYFTTRGSAGPGAPTGLVLSWSKDGAAATPSGGVTLAHIANGRHLLTVNTATDPTTFANGHQYAVYASAGTIDGLPIFEEVVWEFSLAEPSTVPDEVLALLDYIYGKVTLIQNGAPIFVVSNSALYGNLNLTLKKTDDLGIETGAQVTFTISGIPDIVSIVWNLTRGTNVHLTIIDPNVTATEIVEGQWEIKLTVARSLLTGLVNGMYDHGFTATFANGKQKEIASGKAVVTL